MSARIPLWVKLPSGLQLPFPLALLVTYIMGCPTSLSVQQIELMPAVPELPTYSMLLSLSIGLSWRLMGVKLQSEWWTVVGVTFVVRAVSVFVTVPQVPRRFPTRSPVALTLIEVPLMVVANPLL